MMPTAGKPRPDDKGPDSHRRRRRRHWRRLTTLLAVPAGAVAAVTVPRVVKVTAVAPLAFVLPVRPDLRVITLGMRRHSALHAAVASDLAAGGVVSRKEVSEHGSPR